MVLLLHRGILKEFQEHGIQANSLQSLVGKSYETGKAIVADVKKHLDLSNKQELLILKYAEVVKLKIDPTKINKLSDHLFSAEEKENLAALSGKEFNYRWELEDALILKNPSWKKQPETVLNKKINNEIAEQYKMIEGVFKWEPQG